LDDEKIRDVFSIMRKSEINSMLYFIIGVPTETYSDLISTLTSILKLRPALITISFFKFCPKTKIYENFAGEYFNEYETLEDWAPYFSIGSYLVQNVSGLNSNILRIFQKVTTLYNILSYMRTRKKFFSLIIELYKGHLRPIQQEHRMVKRFLEQKIF
jgi:radical SAM superfamily enzyme YgiQ (UPF0313 family)